MSDVSISFPILGDGFVIDPPRYFTLFGRNFYLYGVLIAVGFLLAAWYMMRRSKDFGFTHDNVIDFLLSAVPIGIVGARIYYVVFNPADYFGAGKWGNIIKIWEGGLAIYGGIIAGILGLIVYSRVKKLPLGAVLDVSSMGVLIGQAVGRWGNFFNREAYGARTESVFRMGLISGSGTVYVHPTFLYESLWNVLGLILLHVISKKKRRFDGQIALMYIAWYGLGRYLIEGLRADSLYIPRTDLRVSQLLAAVSFGAALILLLVMFFRPAEKRKPLYVDRAAGAEQSKTSEVTDTAADAPAPEADDDDEYEYVLVDDQGNEISPDESGDIPYPKQ